MKSASSFLNAVVFVQMLLRNDKIVDSCLFYNHFKSPLDLQPRLLGKKTNKIKIETKPFIGVILIYKDVC